MWTARAAAAAAATQRTQSTYSRWHRPVDTARPLTNASLLRAVNMRRRRRPIHILTPADVNLKALGRPVLQQFSQRGQPCCQQFDCKHWETNRSICKCVRGNDETNRFRFLIMDYFQLNHVDNADGHECMQSCLFVFVNDVSRIVDRLLWNFQQLRTARSLLMLKHSTIRGRAPCGQIFGHRPSHFVSPERPNLAC